MIVEDQSEVIAFLSRPDAYGPDVQDVERSETHASIIFLAGSSAYKLKRAVRFPYLDYSTADRRRRSCEAEVEINRRTAPELYRGVIPIVRASGGGLAIGGDGPPVDWLVEMQRFEEDALFSRLAEAGRLDRFAMQNLADAVARFHQDAERRPSGGGAAGLGQVLDSNRLCFAESDPRILDRERTEHLVSRARRAFEEIAPLLDRRRDEGFVRHCHGDLHLRNIVVRNGRAVLFDAIEFDPAFADIDVLYDLAFLVMDLEFRGLRRLASILLNRYLDNTGDAGGLPALPLFLSTRAAIRAHVDAFSATSQSDPGEAVRTRRCRAPLPRSRARLPRARNAAPGRHRRPFRVGKVEAGPRTRAAAGAAPPAPA